MMSRNRSPARALALRTESPFSFSHSSFRTVAIEIRSSLAFDRR